MSRPRLQPGTTRYQTLTAPAPKTVHTVQPHAVRSISVFGAFVLSADPMLKMFGLGLASAVLIDATVVRMVLVPATMALLGGANWWLPGWLDRILPHVDIEGGPDFAPLHPAAVPGSPGSPEEVEGADGAEGAELQPA